MNQFCFVICGPSGVGKTTLVEALLSGYEDIALSVSYTTRQLRGSEVNGKAYHFVEMARFDQMIEGNKFAEWANVHGNKYGTSRQAIEDIWKVGKNVLFDIDYQGENQLREALGERVVSLLVLPPSLAELERRLRGRGTDDEKTIQRRMKNAREEISHFQDFDYIVLNEDLKSAQELVMAIYRSSKHQVAFWEARVSELLNN